MCMRRKTCAVKIVDMSKSEKLAAARKKLREFQSNRDVGGINSPSINTSRSTPEIAQVRTETPPVIDTINKSDNNFNNSAYVNYQQNETNDNIMTFNNTYQNPDVDMLSPPQQMPGDNTISTSTPIYCEAEIQQAHNKESQREIMITSTSESIRQLAMQMNGLIGGDFDSTGSPTIIAEESHISSNNDLLTRNQQLAAQLAEKEHLVAQLQANLSQLQNQASTREEDLQRKIAEVDQKWSGECAALREQLSLHTQTVGILVAEKTEAQCALARAQLAAKTKAAEAEEAQGRLRASRQKLSELESSISSLRSGQESQSEQLASKLEELEKVRKQLRSVESKCKESQDEASQLQQRLNANSQQVATLQTELQERLSQLSIAQVRLQQLGGCVPGGSEVSQTQAELEAEHERRVALEREVAELSAQAAEKDQTSQQYQQFIQQLNTQLTSLASKLQESSDENKVLHERQQSLIHHVGELESQLQRVPSPKAEPSAEQVAVLEQLRGEVVALQADKEALEEKLDKQRQECSGLQIELAKAEERRIELEESRPDEAKLLATMESDKVAAARATSQNTQLKQQLLEQQHKHAQLLDQLRHHEARVQNIEQLQRDLLVAQKEIELLNSENTRLKAEAPLESTGQAQSSLNPEAAERLQDRFAKTMRELAEASDEKQRLEHLVMQLQGETETIGEYVALYQEQRGLLQQKAAEKDKEMARMAADREQMRCKLKTVGQLVSKLVQKPDDEESSENPQSKEVAEKISSLLSEIVDSESLAAPTPTHSVRKHSEVHHNNDTMLPCPLCSGRLEVV